MGNVKKFTIRTFGCQMNEHDSEKLAGILVDDGLVQTAEVEDADVVILNTCCIRENADNKLYGHLGHLKSLQDKRPGLQIAVCGCLAQRDREKLLEKAGHVNVVFGTQNLKSAPRLLRRADKEGSVVEVVDQRDPGMDLGDLPESLSAVREHAHAAWVTIQEGCNNSCAFCIVPTVRGREVSRPMAEIVSEVEHLVGNGVVEVTLLGQNVNSYGRDITGRRPLFSELLKEVGSVPGLERVRFTSPHPKDLRPETIEAMATTNAVCEHLHLPLQSGSDRVLSLMRRGYSAERYLDKLATARASIGDLAVTTDIIVGFPGETEDDFERTLEVAAEAAYDSAYTFIFSARAGTRAAAMEDVFVPDDVIADRFERLRSVVERSALLRHESRIGVTENVLVEGVSKRDRSRMSGRTRQGKLVHFNSAGPIPAGTFADVLVESAAPHHLSGVLQRVTAAPVTRTRIKVVAG
ncbi:MAG: tRNA (N6-isopentenyl adenosine(37)-C2)-methylthiotransferase MiaB [Acidimicrobiales bacterium]|jgi:tRNA-2-methylthio-N6-dimethylallyladenosine synthase